SPELITALLAEARQRQLPVAVDPKFRQFRAYAGCTLFKPNLKELNEGLGLRLGGQDQAGLEAAIEQLRAEMPHQTTLVTLGGDGMLLRSETGYHAFPAHRRTIADVSGAGDTVISLMGAGLAAGLDPVAVTHYANLAGGLVCEHAGVVPVDPASLRAAATGAP
ncbi:MAG: D-glycero-beta-D-manno-heptose-7-phosphate kinase, partial [Bacteroidetes bacterium]